MAKRQARGVLHRHYPGVYSVGHAVLSREGRWLASVFAGGKGALLALMSAMALWNVIRYTPALPDVLVPHGRKPIEGINIRRYRNLHPLDATKYRGIPVTTVARTLVDLTDDLTPEQLTNLIHEAAYRRSFSLTATRQAMQRANGRRNLERLHQAIEAHLNHSAGVRSRDEAKFLRLFEAHDVPKPEINTELHGIEVDFHWPDLKLVAEIDGPGHARPRTRREDRAVDALLDAAGYTVVRLST